MTPIDAAKLLELPPEATPEQCEARFLELRRKIEDRIAKAPTPGLQAKYRESLVTITEAFETLTLAADSSALPVLRKSEPLALSSQPSASVGGVPPPREASTPSGLPANATAGRPVLGGEHTATGRSGSPASRPKASSKEFAIVAVITLLVLAGGGWFVMKTRAENAEKERATIEAKALAERQAESARLEAEAEKMRQIDAAKAEVERKEQLAIKLKTELSELNIHFDATMRTETTAERELSDLKAEERIFQRDAKGGSSPDFRAITAETGAFERYVSWLRDYLATSPARIARAKVEELVSAKALDEAATAMGDYAGKLKQLQDDIATHRKDYLTLTGSLNLTAEPAVVDFTLVDVYGRTRTGRTPAALTNVPLGSATISFQRVGWPDRTQTVVIKRDAPATATADLIGGSLQLISKPFDVDYVLTGQGRTEKGRTPAIFAELPVGNYQITYTRTGWLEQTVSAAITRSGTASSEVSFAPGGTVKITSTPEGAEVWQDNSRLGTTPLTLNDVAPGMLELDLRLDGYVSTKTSGKVKSSTQVELSGTLELTAKKAIELFTQQAAGVWKKGLLGDKLLLRISADSTTIIYRYKPFPPLFKVPDEILEISGYDPATKSITVVFRQIYPGSLTFNGQSLDWTFNIGSGKKKPENYERTTESDW